MTRLRTAAASLALALTALLGSSAAAAADEATTPTKPVADAPVTEAAPPDLGWG